MNILSTINKYLTPYNYTDTNSTDRIKYIVIHYVGATGDAEANCKYFASHYVGASAHYFVGFSGDVWQCVKDEDTAWHCGAKSYKHPHCRNSNSIGIELCVHNKGSQADTSKDWYFEDATVQSAIELTKALMAKYGVPASNVVRHYDVTGKICPNPYVYNHTTHTWDAFKAALTDSGSAEAPAAPAAPAVPAAPSTFVPYTVKVSITDLCIRTGPGTNYAKNGHTGIGVFTIVGEANGTGASKWGKLKSGAGWISLDFAKKVSAGSGSSSAQATIKKGSIVRVKSGAKTYTGGGIASFVYKGTYTVDELKGDRAVLDKNGICTPFNVKDLTLV